MAALNLDYPHPKFKTILEMALWIYRCRASPNGYSPYQLTYGCTPPHSRDSSSVHPVYLREPSEQEISENEKGLNFEHEGEDGLQAIRHRVNSVKYAKNTTRAILAEKKALYREFEVGNWVLRSRTKRHKLEPAFDGPFQISRVLQNNTYTLKTVNEQTLKNDYHANLLFPAYSVEGQPIESPWYSNKRLLNEHRRAYANEADITTPPAAVNLVNDPSWSHELERREMDMYSELWRSLGVHTI